MVDQAQKTFEGKPEYLVQPNTTQLGPFATHPPSFNGQYDIYHPIPMMILKISSASEYANGIVDNHYTKTHF